MQDGPSFRILRMQDARMANQARGLSDFSRSWASRPTRSCLCSQSSLTHENIMYYDLPYIVAGTGLFPFIVCALLLIYDTDNFERPGKEGRRRRLDQKAKKQRPTRLTFNQRGQLVWEDQ